jgi:hypothetical protein
MSGHYVDKDLLETLISSVLLQIGLQNEEVPQCKLRALEMLSKLHGLGAYRKDSGEADQAKELKELMDEIDAQVEEGGLSDLLSTAMPDSPGTTH